MRDWPEVTEPGGFVHCPQEEWVGYPMTACNCGQPWPCDVVRLDAKAEPQ